MNAQATFNQLLEMDTDERRRAIKDMTPEQREVIIDMMGLPKRCSQKQLCSEIEETQRFVRIARSTRDVRRARLLGSGRTHRS